MYEKFFWFFHSHLQTKFDAGSFIYSVVCIACSLIWPYIFCYFASLTTDRVSAIGNIAYDVNWFDFPPKLQKYLILIINRSQEQVQFTGLNLIGCSLEVFGKVSISFQPLNASL